MIGGGTGTHLRIAALLAVLALLVAVSPWNGRTAHADNSPRFLQVLIEQITPQSVTEADSTVTVSGTIRNVGDRPVTDVVARLERADPVAAGSELRSDLHGRTDQFHPIGEFVTVTQTLAQGQQRPFSLSFPLRSSGSTPGPAWDIEKPGVYPALINVNGTPDYGAPARLDDARFLLPVLGVPPVPGSAPVPTSGPDTTHPVGMTLLWPLADRPRLAGGQPGGPGPVRLVDDQLAQSVSPGGRLEILLEAAEFATSDPVDPKGELGRTTCLAVDPDLLVTVNDMTFGYQVLDDAANPASPTHPGAGQGAAAGWLDRLRALAKRMCVAALPYAQADLDAVARIDDAGLSADATTGASDVVDQILGITSLRGATLSAEGQLTRPGVDMLSTQPPTVAVSAPPGQFDPTPRRVSATVLAAPFDPAVSAALSGVGAAPRNPSYVPAAQQFALQHDSRTARLQDAIGSLVWQSLDLRQTPRQQILFPSPTWDLSTNEAHELLATVAGLLHARLAVPRPLPIVIGDTHAAADAAPIDGQFLADSAAPLDDSLCVGLGDQVRRLWGLTAALTVDTRTGLTGTQYTEPLRQDALRAVSESIAPLRREAAARDRLEAIWRTVTDLFNAVTVVNPGGSYTLATEHSPLPLVLRNELPVPIRVGLRVETPAGMRADDVGVQEVPPGFLPVKVPMEVNVTQRVAVDVSLHTPDGLALGEPVRLSVHSNAYGKLLFIITISAASVLFALTARRLWHRFRGRPDRADLDRDDEVWEP